ncbi:MAG: DegT/DnrJ/EryC1/StrS family aminotransferase [Aigarchaeota archaeon]|nr:DegT/DnrJ/EryC1/StrS family aminotransferase [Candidatus Caldarchaeales archaeon]
MFGCCVVDVSVSPLTVVRRHERFRRRCINLVASENILSPAVRMALGSDMGSRYSLRPEFYGGTRHIQEVWRMAEELGRQVFGAEFCSVAPLSGHVALMMALYASVPRGGKIACVDPGFAGYPGLDVDKIPQVLGYSVIKLPEKEMCIDVKEAVEMVSREKPHAVVLGASLILYPMPVQELAEMVHGYGGVVVYDASHVLGLVAGGVFQQPLKEGADIMLGSTHKSFFGPQGGIILTNDTRLAEKIEENTFHKFVDNIHFNRVAALAVALDEMRRYGRRYAARVVENAKTLAESLEKAGLKPFRNRLGYTFSHQVYLPYQVEEAAHVCNILEKNHIIADIGVRFGTCEVTRRGMGSKQMGQIAKLIALALDGADVKKDAVTLANRFKSIKYT